MADGLAREHSVVQAREAGRRRVLCHKRNEAVCRPPRAEGGGAVGRARRTGVGIAANFVFFFAAGQPACAAPDRRRFDPTVDVEAEKEDIISRIIENCPTLTYVGGDQPSGCVA